MKFEYQDYNIILVETHSKLCNKVSRLTMANKLGLDNTSFTKKINELQL